MVRTLLEMGGRRISIGMGVINMPFTPARTRSILVSTSIFLLSLLAFANAASADPVVSFSNSTGLSVVGGSEESNLTLSSSGGDLTVESTSTSISTAGAPCLQMSTQKVTCVYAGYVASNASVVLGGGLDSLDVAASFPTAATVVVTGVNSASSAGAPLDVTTDDVAGPFIGGSPETDRINVASPSFCTGNVDGGGGDDEIYVDLENLSNEDPMECEANEPFLTGGPGDDLIDGNRSTVNLRYEASTGHDVFTGGSGNDRITVGDGPDWAFGGPGNDRFYDVSQAHPIKLWGGPGNDAFTDRISSTRSDWGSGATTVDLAYFDGGSGRDVVSYWSTPEVLPIQVSLDGMPNDGVPGESDNMKRSVENIGGDATAGYSSISYLGDDVFTGSDVANSIFGYQGNDSIDGKAGNDSLKGGVGNDTITGGLGRDSIFGETGDDEIFAIDGEADTITCGGGTGDIVHIDSPLDTATGCETVLTS